MDFQDPTDFSISKLLFVQFLTYPSTYPTMAEPRPSNIVEGATTGDIEEDVPATAKSAEERKAAAAMSTLDRAEDSGSSRDIDQAAIKKAMERLGGPKLANGTAGKQAEEKKVVKKAVKVDAADVSLLVC